MQGRNSVSGEFFIDRVSRGVTGLVAGVLAVFVVFLVGLSAGSSALAAGDANQPSCPASTESSDGFQAYLPDCRAFELVSQVNSDDVGIIMKGYDFPEGEHVYYSDALPVSGTGAGNGITEGFLASRSPSGWRQQAISTPQGEASPEYTPNSGDTTEGTDAISFTSDFSTAFVNSPFQNPSEDPRLAQNTGMNVYGVPLEGNSDSGISLMSTGDSGPTTQAMLENPAYDGNAADIGWGSFLVGSSGDGRKVFFETLAKLSTVPGTPVDTHQSGDEIYEREDGHTYLVGVLPNGTVPACGAEIQYMKSTASKEWEGSPYGQLAPDGSSLVFTTCTGLYLRNTVTDTTVQLPGSSFFGRAGTGPGEEEVIITIGAAITNGGEANIFEYHVTTGQTTEVGEGSDMLAYSASGARVYYKGPKGLMFYNEGITTVIPGTEDSQYNPSVTEDGYAVSTPDGWHLLFIESAKLTAYENKGSDEAYVYDGMDDKVTCASCRPSGMPPEAAFVRAEAKLIVTSNYSGGSDASFFSPRPPLITEDGTRVVFETTEALVPEDTNGIEDVYEWVLLGHDGCSEVSATYGADIRGCVYLLSSGEGTGLVEEYGINGAHLIGASDNLKDVYIYTGEALTPETDNATHIYDVREDGGFPYVPPPVSGCEPGQCRSEAAGSPSLGAPGSVTFTGTGNLAPVPAVVVKTVVSKRKTVSQVKAEKLKKLLKVCRSKPKVKRRACEATVRRRYGVRAGRAMRTIRGGK